MRAQTLDDMRAHMKKLAIDKAFVASSVAIMGEIAAGNAAVADAIEGCDDFLGWCVVNPNWVDASIQEMQKYLRRPDFVGAKMHAAYHGQPLDSALTAQLVKALLRYDKPLLVQVRGESDLRALDALAAQFPSAKIVLGGMAGPHWRAAGELADARVNIILQCGGPVADRDNIAYAMDRAGPHRVVFGTDQPLAHPAFGIGAVRDAALERAQKDAVLLRNAKRLFGL